MLQKNTCQNNKRICINQRKKEKATENDRCSQKKILEKTGKKP